jgi:hypothetical protein
MSPPLQFLLGPPFVSIAGLVVQCIRLIRDPLKRPNNYARELAPIFFEFMRMHE